MKVWHLKLSEIGKKWRTVFLKKATSYKCFVKGEHDDDDDDDDDDNDDDDELFFWYSWPTNSKSPTCRKQDLNLCRTQVQTFLNESVQ